MYARPGKIDPCNKIIDGVVLGDYVSACNKYILARHGITHILTVGSGLMPKFPQGKFVYKIVREYDIPSANLKQHWPSCYQFIDQAIASGGTVLVHCYAGVSRSSSTVIYYLMRKYDLTLKDAHAYTKACRWFINPNLGFQRQLKSVEKEWDKKRGGPGQGRKENLPHTFPVQKQQANPLMISKAGVVTALPGLKNNARLNSSTSNANQPRIPAPIRLAQPAQAASLSTGFAQISGSHQPSVIINRATSNPPRQTGQMIVHELKTRYNDAPTVKSVVKKPTGNYLGFIGHQSMPQNRSTQSACSNSPYITALKSKTCKLSNKQIHIDNRKTSLPDRDRQGTFYNTTKAIPQPTHISKFVKQGDYLSVADNLKSTQILMKTRQLAQTTQNSSDLV